MKIQDYISTLTDEEKEQHKDLIKESLERETEIEELFKEIRDNTEKLCNIFQNMVDNLQYITDSGKKSILEQIPDDKFFNA